jgi:thiol-disulfide isomerase/thioredoxin
MQICGIVTAVFLLTANPSARAGPVVLGVGSMAPDFSARNIMTGETVRLSAEQGRLVVLTFWASWCNPCRRELPILEKAQRVVGKDRMKVLAVNFQDSPGNVSQIKKIMQSWQLTLLEDRNGSIAKRYGISSIPHLFMIDAEGRVVANHLGYGDRTLEELVADINVALHAVPPAPADADAAPSEGASVAPP